MFKNVPIPNDMFCKAAGTGLENICESFKKLGVKGTDKDLPPCYKFFPRKLSDCASNSCRLRYKIYQGIKDKKPENCPDGYKSVCSAYLSRSTKSCEKLALSLSKTYCNFLKRVNKASGNAPGMSDDEIKQHAAQLEMEAAEKRQRAEEERLFEKKRKKEDEKVIKEINSRVKKLLGKK